MTETRTASEPRSWIFPVASWTVFIAIAIALGVYAHAPVFPGVPPGRLVPRVPALPPVLPELFFMLGVGSVIWYAVIIALPLTLLIARRIDTDRYSRAQLALGAFVVFAGLFVITAVIEHTVIYRGMESKPSLVSYLPVALRQDLLPWIAVAAIVTAAEMRRRGIQSRLERERLRAQVAEQRLNDEEKLLARDLLKVAVRMW